MFKTNKYIPVINWFVGWLFFFLNTPKIFQSVLCFVCEPYHSSYGKFPFLAAPQQQRVLQDKDKKYNMMTPRFGHLAGIPVPGLISISQILYTGGTSLRPLEVQLFTTSSSLPLCLTAQIMAIKQPYCPQRSEAQTACSFSSPKMIS